MLNNSNTILQNLRRLGLSVDECKVYLALLAESMSHLEIARRTGVNRTKVYRIADALIKLGLIAETINDEGRELIANDPANLEIALTTAEEKLKGQREVLSRTLPVLQDLYGNNGQVSDNDFIVNTYEGIDGFKQMLWNELKAENEILILGSGALENLVGSKRWAERHRAKTLEAGYVVREILNPGGKPEVFTTNLDFVEKAYNKRHIAADVLPLAHQVCIYNNTVATYNWRDDQKVGVEIINKAFADMQRAIFEQYWELAAQAPS